MVEVFDYISDDNLDLIIRNGDFVVSESTQKHQRDLLLANKGEYKQNPTIGVGIDTFLLSEKNRDDVEAEVTSEFENDGMRIRRLEARSVSEFEIEAPYEKDDNGSR